MGCFAWSVNSMVDLTLLPKLPGIYIFKDKNGCVIYIGKAKSIRKRVSSYFQKSHLEHKVNMLIGEHEFIDYIITKNETEALLLEAQLVKEYQPKYNILLKDGQPFVYIVFTDEDLSKVSFVRNKDIKGRYFGPFLHKFQAKKMFEYLVSTFRLNLCNKRVENGCLDYHLGLCAGNCKIDFDIENYIFRVQLAYDVLKKDHKKILLDLNEKIMIYNKNLEFEKSKHMQEYVDTLDVILNTIKTKFSEDKFEDQIFDSVSQVGKIYNSIESLDFKLQEFFRLDVPIRSIDCFDISHFQSSFLVGSCVRFTNGRPDKNKFRKFKINSIKKQNDYAALQEIVLRRYKLKEDFPDLILIDGGKGQLNAILSLDLVKNAPCASLAKKEETIFSKNLPDGVKLDLKTDIGRLLIALRDYAHHFAVNYHRQRRNKAI